jgi:CRISPR/Cas system CSM-associated protein Csm2 small subunit
VKNILVIMEKINFNFALDVQERTNNSDFIEGLKLVMKEYLNEIDRNKSTNDIIFFKDGSGCKFERHNIVLLSI